MSDVSLHLRGVKPFPSFLQFLQPMGALTRIFLQVLFTLHPLLLPTLLLYPLPRALCCCLIGARRTRRTRRARRTRTKTRVAAAATPATFEEHPSPSGLENIYRLAFSSHVFSSQGSVEFVNFFFSLTLATHALAWLHCPGYRPRWIRGFPHSVQQQSPFS